MTARIVASFFPRPSTGKRRHSRVSTTVILPASLRYRLSSETRVAVYLIFGPVFVLGQEGAPEGSDQSISANVVRTDESFHDGFPRSVIRAEGQGNPSFGPYRREEGAMCYNCVCGKPGDDMGDPKNITDKTFEDAAKASKQSPKEAKRNTLDRVKFRLLSMPAG